jgi:class 3 adenylate cyclase/tetratricopeptide (TPR) repeat protein
MSSAVLASIGFSDEPIGSSTPDLDRSGPYWTLGGFRVSFRQTKAEGAPVDCSECGTANAATAKFCSECGAPLSRRCPHCGTPVAEGVKFCSECGTNLMGAATPSSVRPEESAGTGEPVAERRLVSVLFADLVGFTVLSESRDAEDVRELLSRYFDACRTLIQRYGGTVEKFIGDAVMAVWGAPTATEHDAERSVRAAIDIVDAVAAMGEEVGAPELRARAGVLTGEAAVNLGAQGEGMVAGDMVNTASRIQSAAEPGTVFVGEATRRATESAIAYADAGEHTLKGKAEPVNLWRALRIVAGAQGSLKSVGLEPPFVGRDRELRLVKELFHASADERKAHLVSVTGIAGIGKSRLSWEFYKYFDGLEQLVFYHRGRCLAYGEGVAYWALAEMVRMRAGIVEDEAPGSARDKLRETIRGIVSDREECEWVEPRLGHLLGLEERHTWDREDLFAAWRLFFERMAEQDPVAMVFEDLQWADASLLDFIEYLLEWSRASPIFILTLSRPEIADKRPNWGAGKRNFTSLFLEPLSEGAMRSLLSGFVPGLPADTERQIRERSQGIPLYAVETIRMLVDRGLLTEEDGAYRVTGEIESLDVPETLQALIAARLDGLSADERRVVQDGAVLGKSFFKPGLAQLSGLSAAELEPILSSLVRKEILSLQADPRSPERGQYGFLQDLLRTVAYETLAKRDRKTKHLKAAAFVQEQFAEDEDEVVEVLASHLLRAHDAAPDADDAPQIGARAREVLVRAGERAGSLAAPGEAQRYFEQALELTEAPMERAELEEWAGRMASRAGRLDEATAHLDRSADAFTSIGLTHPAARVSAARAEIDLQMGRLDEGVRRMEDAFSVLSGDEPDGDFAMLAAQLGRMLYFEGHTTEAAEKIERALDLAEALQLPEVLSQALNTKAVILGSAGRTTESNILLRHALEVALENGLSSAALRAYNNLGAGLTALDRHQESVSISEEAAAYARKIGDHHTELMMLSGVVSDGVPLGRWDEALEMAERLAGEDLGLGVSTELQTLVQVYIARGDLGAAEEALGRAGDLSGSEDLQVRSGYLSNLAALRLGQGRPTEALEAGQAAFHLGAQLGIRTPLVKEGLVQALEAAFALNDRDRIEEYLRWIQERRPGEITPYLRAHGARASAKAAASEGEDHAVATGFRAAEEGFRGLSNPYWLARTLLDHGEWLVERDRADEAAPLLAEAGEIFERLRATPWVERARLPVTAEPAAGAVEQT